jgi:cytochrome c553
VPEVFPRLKPQPRAFARGFTLCLVIWGFAAPVAAQEALPDPQAGGRLALQRCASCHTADGSRGMRSIPILQGQSADYTIKQLNDFKAGLRLNSVMQGLVGGLTESDIRNIAAFYAQKEFAPAPPPDAEQAALGEAIFHEGIETDDRSVTACVACHAPDPDARPEASPDLRGQHAAYTAQQLRAFRDGTRTNSEDMSGIMAGVSDDEIKAIAAYLAGLR